MDRQLQAIADDLHAAAQRLRRLDAAVPPSAWHHRSRPGAWSAADCLAHVNLTSRALLPLVSDGLQQARDGRPRSSGHYHRDLVGWLVCAIMAPSCRVKTRTAPAFAPTRTESPEELVLEFDRLQRDLLSSVAASDGLPIDRVKITSPFDSRVRFNLYAALTLVPRHQHRHVAQAERAAGIAQPIALSLDGLTGGLGTRARLAP
jgi:hypothetical protein